MKNTTVDVEKKHGGRGTGGKGVREEIRFIECWNILDKSSEP